MADLREAQKQSYWQYNIILPGARAPSANQPP